MAESAQTLKEFSDNLLSDLDRGAITPQEAISACQQYSFLREAILAKSLPLTQASLDGDKELLDALKQVLSESIKDLRELPNFQSQNPDVQLQEKEIRDMAFLRQTAITRTKEHAKTLRARQQKSRRSFVHELVSAYSSTVPAVDAKNFDAIVDSSLVVASREATTAKAKDRFADMIEASIEQFSDAPVSARQHAQLKTDIQQTLSKNNDYFSFATNITKSEYDLVETLYKHAGLKRPDVVADIVLNAPENAGADVFVRGVKLAQVAESLKTKTGPVSSRGFFTHGNAAGITKGLQQAADGILSVVGEPVRDIVYKNKVYGVFRSLLSNTQELSDRFGEAFTHSSLFTQITQNLTKSLSEKSQVPAAGSFVGDVISTIFKGPLDPSLALAAKERLFDYYDLSRASANAPKGYGFFPSGASPWSVFSTPALLHSSVKTRPLYVRFPYLSFGMLGVWTGNLLSTTVDKTTAFLFSNPSLPSSLSNFRRRAAVRTPISQDLPLLVAIVVITTIVVLFIFPSPFNIPENAYGSKVGAVLSSLYNKEGSLGPGGGQSVDCTQNPTHPLCTFKSCPDCAWPTSGYITQGPNVRCDTKVSHYSGSDIFAVDIAATGGNVPVYSVTSGTVKHVTNTCGEGSVGNSCGGAGYGGYGNNVVIQSDNGYVVIYGHLNGAINPAVSVGSTISVGTQIGWMNNSGSTSGQHLHFGVLSGQNPLDLLPDSPFNKQDILGCVAGWASPKCLLAGKACPIGTVSAQ